VYDDLYVINDIRFIRRLIAERRIEFVKVGRHVRISEAALAAFIAAGRTRRPRPIRRSLTHSISGCERLATMPETKAGTQGSWR
jgi:excisionase family DNA binding protein